MSTLSEDSQDTSGWVYPPQPGTPPTNWGVVYPEQPGRPPVIVILAVPVIDPASGSVPVDVTITTENGLQIIYTTNGTAPGLANGTVAASPLAIHFAVPLTLRAVASNLIDVSDEATATYDPGPVVVIAPSSGEVPLNVVLTSAETTDLIYTLDGTTPTLSNGTQVASPVTLNLLEPCTVRAVAVDGVDTFSVSSGTYVYTGRVGDPRLVAGLIAWYRSDSVEVTAGVVSTWYDQSGNTLHSIPDNTGYPDGGVGPTLVNSVVNGLPVLRFDGAHTFLKSAYQNFGQPGNIFIVAKQSSKATRGVFFTTWGDSHIEFYCNITSGYYFLSADEAPPNPVPGFSLNDTIDHSGAFHNFEAILDGASSAGLVDGVEVFTGNSEIWCPAVINFGRDVTDENYLTGDIAEVIRYGIPGYEPLSVSDRQWVEAYLSNRYNLPNRVPFAPGPLNIAGLAVWLSADALALSEGAEIASWTDSSGNGYTATKGTFGPELRTNVLNGHSVARFSVGDWLNFPALSVSAPQTVIFVAKVNADAYILSDHNGGFMNIMVKTSGLLVHAGAEISDGINHTGAFHVFSVSLVGASTKAYVDGTLTLAGNPLSSVISLAVIGAYDQSGTFAGLSGDIAEIMIFRRPLTDHERQEIELYLKIKYATP